MQTRYNPATITESIDNQIAQDAKNATRYHLLRQEMDRTIDHRCSVAALFRWLQDFRVCPGTAPDEPISILWGMVTLNAVVYFSCDLQRTTIDDALRQLLDES